MNDVLYFNLINLELCYFNTRITCVLVPDTGIH